jgi:hypothetical protein
MKTYEITVEGEDIKRSKNEITGTFELSDGTTTHFSIDLENGWSQWGNSTENLGLTVERVEELFNELLNF